MAVSRQVKGNRTDMSKAEDILFFDAIFLLMVFTFSASTSNASDLSFFTNQIFAPWPSAPQQQTLQNCSWFDVACAIKNQATAGAIGVIGNGIVWGLNMALSLFSRIIAFGNLITRLMFDPALTASGVPFLPIIIVGLNVYVIWELIRTLRGQSITGV